MTDGLSVAIEGLALTLHPARTRAPETTAALARAVPAHVQAVHAQWSGPVLLMDLDLGVAAVENEVSLLTLGDVVYNPSKRQLGITHEEAQFREAVGPVYVTLVGRLEGDLEMLHRIAARVRTDGSKPVTIARA